MVDFLTAAAFADKSLVIKANSLSGNVVVLRATGIQDTVRDTENAG